MPQIAGSGSARACTHPRPFWNATAPNFASGAGGRRNGDERREARPVRLVIKLCQGQAGTPHEQAGGLPDVERAAATDRDNAITVVGAKGLRRFLDILFDRVCVNAKVKKPRLLLLL